MPMISYRLAKLKNRFCQCDECIDTCQEEDETGFWAVCMRCGLPIEDSFVLEGGDYLQSMMLGDE